MNTKNWSVAAASLLAAAMLAAPLAADDSPAKTGKSELKWKSVKSAVETSGTTQLPPGHPAIPMDQLPAGHPSIQGGMSGKAGPMMGGGMMGGATMDTTPMPETVPPPKDRAVAPAASLRMANAPGLLLPVPNDWKETPKDKLPPMRAGVFEIPAPAGESRGATLVLYHFGAGQGGGVAGNIARWVGQLDNAGKPRVYQQKNGDLTVTELLVDGTLKASTMGGPTEAQPDSSLYGIIIEGGPKGSVFVKVTGSKKAVAAAEPAIAALANGVKPAPADAGEGAP